MGSTLQSFHEEVESFLGFFHELGRAWSFIMLGTNFLWILLLMYVVTNNNDAWFWLWNLSVMGITAVVGMIAYCGYVVMSRGDEDFGIHQHRDAMMASVYGALLLVVVLYGAVTFF